MDPRGPLGDRSIDTRYTRSSMYTYEWSNDLSELGQTGWFFGPTAQQAFAAFPRIAVHGRGRAFDERVRRVRVTTAVLQPFERVQQRLFAQRGRTARLVRGLLRHTLFPAVHQHLMTAASKTNKNNRFITK